MSIFDIFKKKWWQKEQEYQPKIPRNLLRSTPRQNSNSSWFEALMRKRAGILPRLREYKKAIRDKVKVGVLVRITPGGRHAWYESNVGLIRKPYQDVTFEYLGKNHG